MNGLVVVFFVATAYFIWLDEKRKTTPKKRKLHKKGTKFTRFHR